MEKSPLPAKLTLVLTPKMQKELLPELDIDVEILQGEREELPDGRTRFICEINDLDKFYRLRTFALNCIAESQQPVQPN